MAMGILEREEFKRMEARLLHLEQLMQQMMDPDSVASEPEGSGRAQIRHTGFGRWDVLYDGERVSVSENENSEMIVQSHWRTKDGAELKAAQLNG